MQDAELRALLSQFGTGEVAGDSVLSSAPDGLLRGWKTALDRASRRRLEPSIRTWVEEELRRLASEGATD